jgi:hypothetical protein
MRVNPVGEKMIGVSSSLPRSVVVVLMLATLRRIRGTNSYPEKSLLLRAMVISSSAPPSM